jgi:hypothetical protein
MINQTILVALLIFNTSVTITTFYVNLFNSLHNQYLLYFAGENFNNVVTQLTLLKTKSRHC